MRFSRSSRISGRRILPSGKGRMRPYEFRCNFGYGKTAYFVKYCVDPGVWNISFLKLFPALRYSFFRLRLLCDPASRLLRSPSPAAKKWRLRQKAAAAIRARHRVPVGFFRFATAQSPIFQGVGHPTGQRFRLFERKWRKRIDFVLFTDFKSLYLHALKSGYPLLLK